MGVLLFEFDSWIECEGRRRFGDFLCSAARTSGVFKPCEMVPLAQLGVFGLIPAEEWTFMRPAMSERTGIGRLFLDRHANVMSSRRRAELHCFGAERVRMRNRGLCSDNVRDKSTSRLLMLRYGVLRHSWKVAVSIVAHWAK